MGGSRPTVRMMSSACDRKKKGSPRNRVAGRAAAPASQSPAAIASDRSTRRHIGELDEQGGRIDSRRDDCPGGRPGRLRAIRGPESCVMNGDARQSMTALALVLAMAA